MLKSEEGQLNAVFACYGSAAQHAQLLEAALGGFLGVYNRLAATDLAIDLGAKEDKLRRMTMGILLRELGKHVTIDSQAVSDCLSEALQQRNFFIHRYFLERQDTFGTQAGRLKALKELVSIENAIEQATILVDGMRVALVRVLDDGQTQCLRLAGRGEKIHEKVCRYGGRVPIREVWRARAMTAAVRRVLGLSETLGTCASSASNETRRS